MAKNIIIAEDFDKRFDAGDDVSDFLDWENAKRPNQNQKRVTIDLPVWLVGSLDLEAKRIGVTRQSIVKVWLAERLKFEQAATAKNG